MDAAETHKERETETHTVTVQSDTTDMQFGSFGGAEGKYRPPQQSHLLKVKREDGFTGNQEWGQLLLAPKNCESCSNRSSENCCDGTQSWVQPGRAALFDPVRQLIRPKQRSVKGGQKILIFFSPSFHRAFLIQKTAIDTPTWMEAQIFSDHQ